MYVLLVVSLWFLVLDAAHWPLITSNQEPYHFAVSTALYSGSKSLNFSIVALRLSCE